ncbi:MAG: Cof-type HAD-IIB family hydrolase [Ilumatobacter sp.]
MKIIASDLDGTLFGPDHELAQRTVEALRAARRAGWMIIAATGRNPISAMERLRRHDVIDMLIGSNGSLVHDPHTDVTVHRFPIADDHVASVFDALDAGLAGLSFCWEMTERSSWDPGFEAIARQHEDLLMFGAGRRPKPPTLVTKIMASHPDASGEELAAQIEPFLPGDLSLGCSGVSFVEITGAGVNKAHALAHVIEPLGASRADVVAFGDNHNDVAMLQWAGRGVAVGNAVEAAQAAADEVIGHHRDHSVAEYIERLLLE